MPTGASFWKFIETRASRAAVAAEWRMVADAGLPAVQGLLAPLETLAEDYPDLRPGSSGRRMRIVRHSDGSIVAIDERDYQNRVVLGHGDVVLHRVDLHKLRKSIADALGDVRISRTSIDEGSATLQVGTWEPKKGVSFPVYLLLCGHPRRLREELLALVSAQIGGAILLTPTRTFWAEDFDATARQWKMLPVPLCEVLTLSAASLVATDAWEEYLQAFAQMIRKSLPGSYRQSKPRAKRAELTAKIEKLKKALKEYIYSARDCVVASIDANRGAALPKTLTKVELAKLAELKPYHISRCFAADPQLRRLLEIANDPEQVLEFGRKRRG